MADEKVSDSDSELETDEQMLKRPEEGEQTKQPGYRCQNVKENPHSIQSSQAITGSWRRER